MKRKTFKTEETEVKPKKFKAHHSQDESAQVRQTQRLILNNNEIHDENFSTMLQLYTKIFRAITSPLTPCDMHTQEPLVTQLALVLSHLVKWAVIVSPQWLTENQNSIEIHLKKIDNKIKIIKHTVN